MVTVQGPVPVQAPVQPTKTESGDGVGSRRRTVPTRWVVEHSWPLGLNGPPPGGFAHVVPGGEMRTTPVPPCTPVTNTSRSWGPRNVAVTCWYSEIGTSHEPVPVQAPIHPVKMESGPGIAVRLTTEFIGGDVEHICVAPGMLAHVVPGGVISTDPCPP